MDIKIRPEQPADYLTVQELTRQAFENLAISDHTEHLLVERLRRSDAFVPELSLVAEADGRIVGHILFTKVTIDNGEQQFEALSLAPVSVLLEYQGKGIGGKLIEEGHQQARALGFTSVLLVGHPEYYPRFGYERASAYGITFPFEAPEEACMVLALTEDGLEGESGEVVFPKAFFG